MVLSTLNTANPALSAALASVPANAAGYPIAIPAYPDQSTIPYASSTTPQEITSYYGINKISFGGVQGDGAGQTIAIVDVGDDPDFVDSTVGGVANPLFATSDLGEFDKYFGLSAPPSFTKVNETGDPTTANLPAPAPGWAGEESLDIEWAHALAPAANIILVECTTATWFDWSTGIATAASISLPNVPPTSVVSMSFGSPEFANENQLESLFTAPNSQGGGVTYVAATGDSGSIGQGGDDPFSGAPAFLQNVVAAGGTSLNMSTTTGTTNETAWNSGGGGESKYVPEPSYQDAVNSTGFRETPDVSFVANPAFGGVAVYDSYDDPFAPWQQVGGTSVAAPCWSALFAIADQGRVLAGGTTLDGTTQTLPALYSLPYSDFNDIVAGDNEGHGAQPGYDMATGLGSPKANLLIPDLAAYGLATEVAVTTQPPTSVYAGDRFGLSIAVEDSLGNVDSGFSGTATLTQVGNPLFTPVVGTVTNGVAIFDGLTLSEGGPYNFKIVVANAVGSSVLISNSTTSDSVTVGASQPSGSATYYPAPSYTSLNTAFTSADSDPNANVTIMLEAGTYALNAATPGQLVIQDLTGGLSHKTITIIGAGTGATIIEPSDAKGWDNRIFEIVSHTGATVTVYFQNLTIAGGQATNGGVLGGTTALGGGVLIDGGTVYMTSVNLVSNIAWGTPGANGASNTKKDQPGGAAANGDAAEGAGIYLTGGGTVTLNNDEFTQDIAWGGRGGTGGKGGPTGGRGGTGGVGGFAAGGGAYVAAGTLKGTSDLFKSDAGEGGSGGYGGEGGVGGNFRRLGRGGTPALEATALPAESSSSKAALTSPRPPSPATWPVGARVEPAARGVSPARSASVRRRPRRSFSRPAPAACRDTAAMPAAVPST